MKKMNKKGFMLTETLIVATMLISVLLILYIQFKTVNRSFTSSFSYNTVGSSYNLYNAKKYIEISNYSLIAEKLKVQDYVDLTDCPGMYFADTDYCETLFLRLGVKKLLMTNENIASLVEDNDLDAGMNEYLKKIKYEQADGYRIIGYFKDGTYSSLKILNSKKFDFVISNSCSADTNVNYTIKHLALNNLDNVNNGYTLYEDTVSFDRCGASILVSNYEKDDDACYYLHKSSGSSIDSPYLDLGLNEDANIGVLYYGRYDSKITIYHYKEGTTEELANATIVSNFCGNVIETEQYRKNITGYTYVSASLDEVKLDRNDTSVILYYREGGPIEN